MKFRACVLVASCCWLLCFSVGCHKPVKTVIMLGDEGAPPEEYVDPGSTIEIRGDISSTPFDFAAEASPLAGQPQAPTVTCDASTVNQQTHERSVICHIPPVKNKHGKFEYTLTIGPPDKNGKLLEGAPSITTRTFYVRPCPPICMP